MCSLDLSFQLGKLGTYLAPFLQIACTTLVRYMYHPPHHEVSSPC
jgi:hypothetical protein